MNLETVISTLEDMFSSFSERTHKPLVREPAYPHSIHHVKKDCASIEESALSSLTENVIVKNSDIFPESVCILCAFPIWEEVHSLERLGRLSSILEDCRKLNPDDKSVLALYNDLIFIDEYILQAMDIFPVLRVEESISSSLLEAVRVHTRTVWKQYADLEFPGLLAATEKEHGYLYAHRETELYDDLSDALSDPDSLCRAVDATDGSFFFGSTSFLVENGYLRDCSMPMLSSTLTLSVIETTLSFLGDGINWVDALRSAVALNN